MVAFGDLQFVLGEENIPDHMSMSGKQFKIMNRKLNSLLQIQADKGSRNSFSVIEVDLMLKSQEHRLKTLMEQIDTKTEDRLKRQSEFFVHEVKELRPVAKERHILFVQAYKRVQEDVNFKIEELLTELYKEISTLYQSYSNLHKKVDIIADIGTKVTES